MDAGRSGAATFRLRPKSCPSAGAKSGTWPAPTRKCRCRITDPNRASWRLAIGPGSQADSGQRFRLFRWAGPGHVSRAASGVTMGAPFRLRQRRPRSGPASRGAAAPCWAPQAGAGSWGLGTADRAGGSSLAGHWPWTGLHASLSFVLCSGDDHRMFLEARVGAVRRLCQCSACCVSGVARGAGGERPCRKAVPWALFCVANAGSRGAGLEPKASGLPAKCSLSQGGPCLSLGTRWWPCSLAHTEGMCLLALCAGDPGDL